MRLVGRRDRLFQREVRDEYGRQLKRVLPTGGLRLAARTCSQQHRHDPANPRRSAQSSQRHNLTLRRASVDGAERVREMRMPSFVECLWLAVALSALPEALRWWRSSRSVWAVRRAADTNAPPMGFLMTAAAPTRTRDDADLTRTLDADDTADLVRMDDDGGPQVGVAADPVRRLG